MHQSLETPTETDTQEHVYQKPVSEINELKQHLPTSQKHAIVKTGLDTADMANFRPVSNLSFMSKVVERAVVSQLTEYLSTNNLLPCFQSAYRKRHSTKTAIVTRFVGHADGC